eukprot:4214902-Ditylum_brightwellii.AAC.1
MLLRFNGTVSSPFYLPGSFNVMADDASRLTYLDPTSLVAYFNARYPQHTSWTLTPLPSAMKSKLYTTLFRARLPLELLLDDAAWTPPHGANGQNSVSGSAYQPISLTSVIPSQYSSYSHTRSDPVSWQPAARRSGNV